MLIIVRVSYAFIIAIIGILITLLLIFTFFLRMSVWLTGIRILHVNDEKD